MRIHHIRHSAPTFPFNREPWLVSSGHSFSRTLFCDGEKPPRIGDIDALVVFGGMMSAYEEMKHPWLLAEMAWIEQAMNAGIPVVGICLGSQLLSRIMGAPVYKNPAGPELGFFPVSLTTEGKASPFFRGFPETFTAFEWHNDVFDLPSGAKRIAKTAFWKNQGWVSGDLTLAIQFHLEFTNAHIASALDEEGDSLPVPKASVQASGNIKANRAGFEAIDTQCGQLLENIIAVTANSRTCS